MKRTGRRSEAWLVVLGSTGLLAWSALLLGSVGATMPAFCSPEGLWALPLPASLALALVVNSPAQLAGGWALMIAAMMSPLVAAPLRHVHARSLAKRRARSLLLFVAGYAAVWMTAGVGFQTMALVARWVAPAWPVRFGLAAAAAVLWQVSPAKQWCMNRCHRRPHLAAFGLAADRDAFAFGLTNGVSCCGTCWALMTLPLLAERDHVSGMIAVALFTFAERFERPAPLAWRWRGPGKALRIVVMQTRIRLPHPIFAPDRVL